jgi:hypothetical protein
MLKHHPVADAPTVTAQRMARAERWPLTPVSAQNSTQIGSSRHDGMAGTDTSMIGTLDKPHDHQARACVM